MRMSTKYGEKPWLYSTCLRALFKSLTCITCQAAWWEIARRLGINGFIGFSFSDNPCVLLTILLENSECSTAPWKSINLEDAGNFLFRGLKGLLSGTGFAKKTGHTSTVYCILGGKLFTLQGPFHTSFDWEPYKWSYNLTTGRGPPLHLRYQLPIYFRPFSRGQRCPPQAIVKEPKRDGN